MVVVLFIECVRRKILDLLGKNLAGAVKAFKASHAFNRLVIKYFYSNILSNAVLDEAK